jgi:CRISPR-associated protein Csb1
MIEASTNEVEQQKAEQQKAVTLLDGLLGIDVRKPGNAAKLPAVIRVIESLEPAGGMQFPVFPASYAGDGQSAPPVYDLNGIEYGPELEVVKGKDRERSHRYILSARQCTIDSPQSQANRTEIAFLEDEELKPLVPQASASIPREDGKKAKDSILCLPHRIADFRVRLSDKQDSVRDAIRDFANGDSLKLIRLMPTSIIFGFWDSRGDESQHKHARLLLSRIDAFDVVPCTKHAIYSGPYSKDEFAEIVLASSELAAASQDEVGRETEETKSATAKKAFKKMAERGFTPAPSAGLGGVLVRGKIERLALLSLTDIARLWCRDKDNDKQKEFTNAARRYVFALAALAEGHPRSTGSHRLRSGCELLTLTDGLAVELRGGDSTYEDAAALIALFKNRKLLIAVAQQAHERLSIPLQLDDFVVTKQSLKFDFDRSPSNLNQGTSDGTSTGDTKPKRSRGK